jgi:hypothetical protein
MVSEIDIMPGGSNSLKPGQPRSTNINTVQTLFKAKLGSTKEKAPKKGRTHSQLSNDSNNSIEFDLSGLDHIQKDLEEIKSSLQGVTKITEKSKKLMIMNCNLLLMFNCFWKCYFQVWIKIRRCILQCRLKKHERS